jgi:transposase
VRAPAPLKATSTDTSPDGSEPAGQEPVGRRAQRKKAAHDLVHQLLAQGHPRRAIARHLGWGLNTVLRYARAAYWQDTLRENRPRPSRLDPYKPYLDRQFAAGCSNVTLLHRELLAENAPVTYQMVRAYIATLRATPPQAQPPPPTVRQVTSWLTRHPTALSEEDRAALKGVLARLSAYTSTCSAAYGCTCSAPGQTDCANRSASSSSQSRHSSSDATTLAAVAADSPTEWELQHQLVTTPPPPPSPTAQCHPQAHRPYRAARSAVTSVVKRRLSSHPAPAGGTIEAITVAT